MVVFLLYMLAAVGLTSIVVDSEFFRWLKEPLAKWTQARVERLGEKNRSNRMLRKASYLLSCYQCSGLWVGFFLAMWINPLAGTGCWRLAAYVACGGAVSFAAQVGMALYNYLNVDYGPRE